MDGELVVVGGAWPNHNIIRPDTDGSNNEALPDDLAPMMMDFMLKRLDFFETTSICHVPVAQAGHTPLVVMNHVQSVLEATLRARTVGTVAIAYDNATSFQMLNNLLLGKPLPVDLRCDPFWSSCVAVKVDSPTWPLGALAVKRCVNRCETWQIVFGSNDPSHVLKIVASQARTNAKTIMLGNLTVDCSACLANGAPVDSDGGKKRQSDQEAALLLLFSCPGPKNKLTFGGCGCLVYNFVMTAALTPWFDPHLSAHWRHLLSAFAFYFLHLARWHTYKVANSREYAK